MSSLRHLAEGVQGVRCTYKYTPARARCHFPLSSMTRRAAPAPLEQEKRLQKSSCPCRTSPGSSQACFPPAQHPKMPSSHRCPKQEPLPARGEVLGLGQEHLAITERPKFHSNGREKIIYLLKKKKSKCDSGPFQEGGSGDRNSNPCPKDCLSTSAKARSIQLRVNSPWGRDGNSCLVVLLSSARKAGFLLSSASKAGFLSQKQLWAGGACSKFH